MLVGEPGLVVLFGSGETSASGRKVFDWLFRRLSPPVQMAILETPAGFELNSAQVAGRVADFLRRRLQNYRPQMAIVPARKRGTRFSPDDPEIVAPLLEAEAIFLGPGSPTYAVRQLQDSLAWNILMARHRLGATVILASAAVIASSARALPVYEIYKVGQELHWVEGLDFFGAYGLSLVFVPHWNNAEGGSELDTSRCYMGQARFEPLHAMLPPDATVVGIDEHTALVFDPAAETCHALGKGGVTLLRSGTEKHFESGQTFSVQELGPFRRPAFQDDLPPQVWAQVQAAQAQARPEPPPKVRALVEERAAARTRRDWAAADALREQIAALGWRVVDTPQGPQLEREG